MYREPAPVDDIRLVVKLLEELRIQHADDEIERTVVVGNDGEDRPLFLPQKRQFHLIGLRDSSKGFQIEFLQPGEKRDLDRL